VAYTGNMALDILKMTCNLEPYVRTPALSLAGPTPYNAFFNAWANAAAVGMLLVVGINH